jgi:hypothetical protein
MRISAASLFLLVTLAAALPAQILEQLPQKGSTPGGGGAYYDFKSGTGCDIKVSIWGYVGNPGRYNIPCESTLLELISFAGGPRRGAQLSNLKIIRRGGADAPLEIKEVIPLDLEKHLQLSVVSSRATDLLLLPGDLVIVDGTEPESGDTLLRILQGIVAVTSVVTAVLAVINMTKK